MDWKLSGYYVYDMVRTKKGLVKGIKFIRVDKLQYRFYDEEGNFEKTLEVDIETRKVTDITNNIPLKEKITTLVRKEERNSKGYYTVFAIKDDNEEIKVSYISSTELSTYLKKFSKYENCKLKNMSGILDCIAETYGEQEYYTNTDVKRVMQNNKIYEAQGISLDLQNIEEQQNKCGVANLYLLDVRKDKIIFSVDFLVANDGKAVNLVKENPKDFVKLLKLYYDKFANQELPFDRFIVKKFKVITGMTLDFICYPKTKEDLLRIKTKTVRPSMYDAG